MAILILTIIIVITVNLFNYIAVNVIIYYKKLVAVYFFLNWNRIYFQFLLCFINIGFLT